MSDNKQGLGIERAYKRYEAWLRLWPNPALTIALLIGAGIIVYIALRATPAEKVLALAYITLP